MIALARKSLRMPWLLTPTDDQLAWSNHVISTSVEYKRLQIAQQIHDGPFGNLFAIYFLLSSLRSQLIEHSSDVAPLCLTSQTSKNPLGKWIQARAGLKFSANRARFISADLT
jgi:hypothetical protein